MHVKAYFEDLGEESQLTSYCGRTESSRFVSIISIAAQFGR